MSGFERGNCFTSIPFDSGQLPAVATPQVVPRVLQIFKGQGFGFIIHAAGIDLPHSTLLKLNVGGFGNQGNEVMWVAPNTWYWGPFSYIQVIPNDQLAFGEVDVGQWVCDIAIKPYARIHPSLVNNGFAGIPASSGGSPPLNSFQLNLDIGGVKPTLFTDGIEVGGTAQLESVFQVQVFVSENPLNLEFFTGGGIDIWRMSLGGGDALGPQGNYSWSKVADNIPLITGERSVCLPVDYFGPRDFGDRFYATPSSSNPVTVSGATTTICLLLRIQ